MRVPLNAATLAVQNMGASGTIVKDMEIEFDALKGSLETMSKGRYPCLPADRRLLTATVLNDVLDFNRIDSGNFESVSKVRTLQSYKALLLTAGSHSIFIKRSQHCIILSIFQPLTRDYILTWIWILKLKKSVCNY